jgi:hypothetical protein
MVMSGMQFSSDGEESHARHPLPSRGMHSDQGTTTGRMALPTRLTCACQREDR